MDTAITRHTTSRGGAPAPPRPLFRPGNPGLANLLITGGDVAERLQIARSFHDSGRLRRGPFVATSSRNHDWTLVFFRALSSQPLSIPNCPLQGAEGGTLFVDEIDALAPRAQRLMLEFLNRGRATPLHVSGWAGVIAVGASHDLSWSVGNGEFLSSLYDCLDKIRVNLDLVA